MEAVGISLAQDTPCLSGRQLLHGNLRVTVQNRLLQTEHVIIDKGSALIFAVHIDLRGSGKVLAEHIRRAFQSHHIADVRLMDSHLHIRGFIGAFSVFPVSIPFSVKEIILQKLHIRHIPFGLPAGLMILHHGSRMDIQLIQNLRRDLVGAESLILLLQAHIVHDHIRGVKEIAVADILHRKSQSGQMIAVHDEHVILSVSVQRRNQVYNKLIHLMKLIYIVLPLVVLFLCLGSRDLNGRVLQDLLRGILAVSLDRDGINEILARRGIQAVQNMFYQHLILQPAVFRGVGYIHIFLGGVSLKAQIFKHIRAAVEGSLVIVDSVGCISDISQIISHTLTGRFLENGFIGIFSRSEIPEIHAGNRLKFCVGRTRAHRRNLKSSRRIFFHQSVEIGNGIFGKLQEFHRGRIEKGFQLQKNDVRFLRIIVLIRQSLFVPVHNSLNGLFRIIIRLIHSCGQKTAEKAIGKAVILIGKGNISKVSGQHPLFQTEPCGSRKEGNHRQQARNINRVSDLFLILRGKHPEQHQNHNSENNPSYFNNDLIRRHIAV